MKALAVRTAFVAMSVIAGADMSFAADVFDASARYAVVDLSGGWRATNWPVRVSSEGPDLADDRCRTEELWLRLVPAGTFAMGSPSDEFGHDLQGKETRHAVTLTKPFYVGVFEVSQRQYELVTGRNPSEHRGACRPVDGVSYDDLRGARSGGGWPRSRAVDPDSFFGRLQAKTSLRFDLPTEAMWEYACRAGTATAYNDGTPSSDEPHDPRVKRLARTCLNTGAAAGGFAGGTGRVGSLAPNAWGLYDMHGNVAEWCLDWYRDDLGPDAATDPVGPATGCFRTLRGGSCAFDVCAGWPVSCRSAARGPFQLAESLSSARFKAWGFRVCLTVDALAADLAAEVPTPAESSLFVRHVDPESKVESWLLRPGLLGHNQQGLYFTADSMTEDGRFLVFDVTDDETVPGFEKDRDFACAFCRRKAVADLLKGDVYELGGVFKGIIPFLDVKTAQLYQIDYEGVHRRDLRDDPMRDVLVCRTPKELVDDYANPQTILATHLTLSPDRTKAYLDTRSTKGPSRPGLLDLKTGVFTPWTSLPFYSNHGQLSPVRDDEALGAWEAAHVLTFPELAPEERKIAKSQFPPPYVTDRKRPTDTVYPRLWLFRADGTARMIPSRINNYATHESFTRDGRGITFSCSNWTRTHASSFTLHDLATDVQHDIVPYLTMHGVLSPDGRYVVFDVPVGDWWRGCPWRVGVWDRLRHRGLWIHTFMPEYRPRTDRSVLHPDPHPAFTADGRYVVCTLFGADRRMHVAVTPFDGVRRKLDALPAPTPKAFPLAWDASRPTDRAYELVFDAQRMVEEGRVDGPSLGGTWRPHTAYALEATVAGARRRLAVDPLPGRNSRELVLRFRVPEGMTGLTLVADVPEQFEIRDTVTCDNLFAGEVEPAHPFGTMARHFERPVPAALHGKRVKLEWTVRNQSGADVHNALRATALRADGSACGEVFAAADLGGTFADRQARTVFAEGALPADAAAIRLEVVAAGEMLTQRLVLREGTSVELEEPPQTASVADERAALAAQADKTAAWQIATPVTTGRFVHQHTPLYWTMGAFYNGLVHWGLSEGSRSRFADYVRSVGAAEKWRRQTLERSVLGDADTHCVCAAWLQLAAEDNVLAGRIDSAKECFDALIADKTEYPTEFSRKDRLARMRWTWADALYMSPPSWVLLAGLTGEGKYLAHMAREYRVTAERLFNVRDGLFYRDATYLPGGANWKGRDVYWSRGNGWVFGGLAMILRDLPAASSDRGWFEDLFRRMARGVAARQQADGSWHPDLADPKSPDCPEMSGTSFFAFAYLWGLNNGLLDRATYEPVAERAWQAVNRAIDPATGRLGYVQQVGSSPTAELKPEYFEFYATGAYLCAAAEMKTFLELRNQPDAVRHVFVNGPSFAPGCSVSLPWNRDGEPVVWDVRYARPASVTARTDGRVEVTVNALAGQRREFLVFARSPTSSDGRWRQGNGTAESRRTRPDRGKTRKDD